MLNIYKTVLKSILLVAFIFSICGSSHAGDKIKLRLWQPAPNKLGAPDLWKLDIENTSRETVNIYLTGTVSASKKGLIVSGRSKVFSVKPGKKTYGYNDFKTGEVTWNDRSMEMVILRTGNVPEEDYTICVTAFYENNEVADQEQCIQQTVRQEGSITLISPKDGEILPEGQLPTFTWMPSTTAPRDVKYSLRIFEIKSSQTLSDAIQRNATWFEKREIRTTTFQYPTSAKKMENGKKYAWMVQATDKDGKPYGGNNGTSEPASFAFSACDVNLSLKLDSIKCSPSINGNNKYILCITAAYTSATYNLTYSNTGSGLQAYHPSYAPTYPISNLTPTLQVQNIGPTTSVKYCFEVTVPAAQTAIIIALQGDDKDPGPIVCQPGASLDVTLPLCACDACDEKHFRFDTPTPSQINISNNILSFNQPVTIVTSPPKTIKNIKTDLVYFEMIPENNLCIPCNKDAATYGHFTNGTNSIEWNGTQQNLNINITTPQITPCCSALFKWCIRYKIEFTDCTTCNKLVCYEKKKDGCEKINNNNNNNPK